MLIHFWLPFLGGLLAYAAIVSGGVWLISRCERRHNDA